MFTVEQVVSYSGNITLPVSHGVRLHHSGCIIVADALSGEIQGFLRISIASVDETLRDAGDSTGDLFGQALRVDR